MNIADAAIDAVGEADEAEVLGELLQLLAYSENVVDLPEVQSSRVGYVFNRQYQNSAPTVRITRNCEYQFQLLYSIE